jgi:hypothetical protein
MSRTVRMRAAAATLGATALLAAPMASAQADTNVAPNQALAKIFHRVEWKIAHDDAAVMNAFGAYAGGASAPMVQALKAEVQNARSARDQIAAEVTGSPAYKHAQWRAERALSALESAFHALESDAQHGQAVYAGQVQSAVNAAQQVRNELIAFVQQHH